MDEILYELRDHSAGLNCGRWDYIFSFIKKFAGDTSVLLPDRGQVTMTTHFMRSYSKLCIKTCHRRNVSAMGGMSALIPIKSDPVANEKAIAGVRADKEREATDGHDGTWVAHPGLVPVALEVFNRVMPQPNQIAKQLPDYTTHRRRPAPGSRRHHHRSRPQAERRRRPRLRRSVAARHRLRAALQPDGRRRHRRDQPRPALAVGPPRRKDHRRPQHRHRPSPTALVEQTIANELAATRPKVDDARFSAYQRAADLMRKLIASPTFPEFLTVPAYAEVLAAEKF